ncbi:MAG: SLBB domain-containing protein [Phycisphaerales bacterium]
MMESKTTNPESTNLRPLRPLRIAQQRAALRLTLLAGTLGVPALLGGCGADSFIDPSVTGRWENTPVSVPILDRLVAIEGPSGGQAVETTSVRSDDLIPEPEAYRLGPGDALEVRITDFEGEGRDGIFPREVDPRGFLTLPFGSVQIDGLAIEDVQQGIAAKLIEGNILTAPVVQVEVTARRRATFNVIGAVGQPGLYGIPRPDYRLLEALTAAGRFSESIQSIYVIRQIPLADKFTRGNVPKPGAARPMKPDGGGATPTTTPPTPSAPKTDSLIDLIDELSKPGMPEKKEIEKKDQIPMPGVLRSRTAPRLMDDPPPGVPTPPTPPPATGDGQREPLIDLTGEERAPKTDGKAPPVDLKPTEPAPRPASSPQVAEPERFWIFRDGKWVQVSRMGVPPQKPDPSDPNAVPLAPAPRPEYQGVPGVPSPAPRINPPNMDLTPAPPSVPNADLLVTQRVIEVPMGPLLAGSAQFNIIIRPGDVIRVPSAPEGVVYVSGEVNRPGTYGLPSTGKLTLTRAIVAAGGLSNIAIPERVDLTRMIGPDRQATVMVDFRAIKEGTAPDITLKNDDVVNVGTNFWAFPLAVVRQGFRASYGFGFILDRNFQGEVFGPDQATSRQ